MNNEVKEYYPYFDYLRITLAITVMFAHDNIIEWHQAGGLAVEVFFALSGWLIGSILLTSKTRDLSRFYFNRAIRIWIPYYLALLFIVAASVLKDPIDAKWLEFIVYKITWVYNLFGTPQLALDAPNMPLNGTGNHFWSVNAEEQFYLLAPLLLVIFGCIGKHVFTWLLVVIALLLLDAYAAISFGVLAAVFRHHIGNFQQLMLNKILCAAVLCTSTLALLYEYNASIAAPFFAISIVLLLAVKGKQHKVGAFLGGMSYSLYLNHWIGVFLFNLVLDPWDLRNSVLRQCLASVFSLILAALLYQYLEKQLLDRRARLYSEDRGRLVTYFAYISICCGLLIACFIEFELNKLFMLLIFVATGSIIIGLLIKANSTIDSNPHNVDKRLASND